MLKRFSFRLDSVLRHRGNIRDLKEREFSEVEAQLLKEEHLLSELVRMQAEMLETLAGLQSGGFENMERELYSQYLGWLSSEIARQRQVIADTRVVLEAKRAELVKALQEHRVVERLRERQYEGYTKEVERASQVVLDEIAGGAHARGVRIMGAAGGAQ